VPQLSATVAEDFSNQEPTMTLVWLATATQQRQPMVAGAFENPSNGRLEIRLSSHLSVQSVASRVVMLVAFGSSAKSVAKKEIADAERLHRGL